MDKKQLNNIEARLYSNDFVDEAIAVSDLFKEHQALLEKIKDGAPICPFCLEVMKPINFEGYYDQFPCWICDCDSFDGAETARGGYA